MSNEKKVQEFVEWLIERERTDQHIAYLALIQPWRDAQYSWVNLIWGNR